MDDERIVPDTADAANIIEFSASPSVYPSSSYLFPVVTSAYEVKPAAEMEVVVSYSGTDVAPEDITVNIEVLPALIDEFNAKVEADARAEAIATNDDPDAAAEDALFENGYDLMPSELYELKATQVTIKKGERKAILPITVHTDQFDFSKQYGIPLKISGASTGTISGNFGAAIFNVKAKNQYDGKYSYKGAADQSLGAGKEATIVMATTGEFTVKTGLVATYSNEVFYTVDPATNKVTVSMTTLLPIATDPSSHYDPATKTFHVKWTSNGGARHFEETIKYIKPR
ncbi:DUF1735 domain-containing protein [Pontibacter sp. MBLB2868]|uniref:DUF1735 domain-containing protein n=1 Tax=Pontibacter sp. MBLB2868 TaxID=3451555 RepID=UPI003F74E963